MRKGRVSEKIGVHAGAFVSQPIIMLRCDRAEMGVVHLRAVRRAAVEKGWCPSSRLRVARFFDGCLRHPLSLQTGRQGDAAEACRPA